ncbi:MAG: hypothetical protein KC425_20780, partial [Anaerolineales bacterium]|nr:hypothetical protein [Anaerolineales bacterium]
ALIVAPIVVTVEANAAADPNSRTPVTIVMIVLLAVILFAIQRSRREDEEAKEMVETVAHAGKTAAGD